MTHNPKSRSRQNIIAVALIGGMTFLCLAQCCAQQILYKQYTAEEHGGSNQNWGMSQDSVGNIYVANSNGVLVFNGINWNLVSLPSREFIRTMAVSPSGRCYIGLVKGMGYLERDHHGKFQYHSLLPLLNEQQTSQLKEIAGIKVVGGKVFLNDLEHVYVFDGTRLTVFHEPNSGAPKLKNRYCIIKNDGIYEYNNNKFAKSKLLTGFNTMNIKFLADYKDNQIIVLTPEGELSRVTMKADSTSSSEAFSVNLAKKINLANVENVLGLRDGRVVLLSEDQLVIIDGDGNVLQTLTKEALGYPFQTFFAFEDSFHNYWCGNAESLVNIKLNSPLSVFDRYNGLKGAVWALAKHNGNVYFGSNKGISYRDSNKIMHSVRGTDGEIIQFLELEKKLYALDPLGIVSIDHGSAKRVLDHEWPNSLAHLPQRCLLMTAYESGLWLVHTDSTPWTKFKLDGMDDQYYFAITDGDGNVWLAEYGHRLWRIKIDVEKRVIVDKQLCDTSTGLPTNFNNRAQRTSNGDVLFSTEAGIYRYDEIRHRFEPHPNYAGDLTSRPVYNLDESENGVLYFFTTDPANSGKTIASMARKGNDGKYSTTFWPFRIFSWIDPYAPVLVISENEVLFGNNVRVIDYDTQQNTELPKPIVYITGIVAGDSVSTTSISNSRFRFSYDQNDLRISFIAPFFDNAEKVLYQYKIEGLSDDWTDWSEARDATIPILREGDYIFTVRAKNLYGYITDASAIAIHIDPPFYRTLPAYLFYIISAVCAMYGLVRLNTMRIERQRRKLQREVARMTHELASINEEIMAQNEEMIQINQEINKKNAAISAQAEELLQSNFTKDKIFSIVSHDLRGPINQLHEILNLAAAGHLSRQELETFLPVLHERSREMSVLIDNILYWAKDQMTGTKAVPVNLLLAPVIRETVSLFKAQVKKKGIEVLMNINDDLTVFADKDIVKLIVRNFIANAVKFTHEKGTITISATSDNLFTKISVADNGVGLSEEEVSKLLSNESFSKSGTRGEHGTGIGLMMCKEFITKNGGTFFIQSSVGKGSVFSFTVPAIDRSL